MILDALIGIAVDAAMILLIQRLKFPHSGPPDGVLGSAECLPVAHALRITAYLCYDCFAETGPDGHYYVDQLHKFSRLQNMNEPLKPMKMVREKVALLTGSVLGRIIVLPRNTVVRSHRSRHALHASGTEATRREGLKWCPLLLFSEKVTVASWSVTSLSHRGCVRG